MRTHVKVLLLSILVGTSCLPEECGVDCNRDGDPDCRADVVGSNPLPSTPPPGPLTLSCRALNSGPESELEWQLTIGGGTPPFSYTLNFGDDTPVLSGSWSGAGSDPRGFHEYERGGDFPMTGQVRDAANQVQGCALTYTAPDPDLRVRCTATPTTGTAPLTVKFDVISRSGCVGPCEVTWYFGDGQTHVGGDVHHTYEYPGPSGASSYAAFAEIRDSRDHIDQCRRPIQVLPDTVGPPPPPSNHPPSIDSASASPSSVIAGQSATISGTTSDPDPGDVVSWQLTFDSVDSGTLSPTSGTGPILSTYTSSPTARGNKSIRVTAFDLAGALAPYRTITVNVIEATPNRPPNIIGLSAAPVTIIRGGPPSRVQATVTDPDGDPVTWTVTLDPSSTAAGTFSAASGTGNIDTNFSGTRQGIAVIRATASDPQGATSTSTVTVTVIIGG